MVGKRVQKVKSEFKEWKRVRGIGNGFKGWEVGLIQGDWVQKVKGKWDGTFFEGWEVGTRVRESVYRIRNGFKEWEVTWDIGSGLEER